jgi:hypothetical protein
LGDSHDGCRSNEVENRENRLPGFLIFILRHKFDLFEKFVIYLICFVFFMKSADEGRAERRMGDDEKQHCADIAFWRVARFAN